MSIGEIVSTVLSVISILLGSWVSIYIYRYNKDKSYEKEYLQSFESILDQELAEKLDREYDKESDDNKLFIKNRTLKLVKLIERLFSEYKGTDDVIKEKLSYYLNRKKTNKWKP